MSCGIIRFSYVVCAASKSSLQPQLSQAGSGEVEVEAVVGCSSIPVEAAQVAAPVQRPATRLSDARALHAATRGYGRRCSYSMVATQESQPSSLVGRGRNCPFFLKLSCL
jgi:hypothetical protein